MILRPFISYAREDLDSAKKLHEFLLRNGQSPFFDGNIKPGDRWLQTITESLKHAHSLIVLWSEKASESTFIPAEVLIARTLDLRVVVQRLDNSRLPAFLNDLQYLEAPLELDRLLTAITGLELASLEIESPESVYLKIHDAIADDPQLLNPQYGTYVNFSKLGPIERGITRVDTFGSHTVENVDIDVLFGRRRLVTIEGEMGSGKSTFALQILRREIGAKREALYVHLGTIASGEPLPLVDHVVRFIVDRLHAQFASAREAVVAMLQRGCLVALDGFDELPKGGQVLLIKSIRAFLDDKNFEKTKILLTSRPSHVVRQRLSELSQQTIWQMLDLQPAEVRALIHRRVVNAAVAEKLLDALKSPRIRDLARTPLLLLMLCTLAENNESLEGPRAAIIQRVVHVSLSQRDPMLGNKRSIEILEPLALGAQQLSILDIPNGLCLGLLAMQGNDYEPSQDLSEIIDLLHEVGLRSGLLLVEADRIRFSHRAIQEYLCASGLGRMRGGEDLLLDYSALFTWEGVVRLYVELISDSERQISFITRLWTRNGGLALRSCESATNGVQAVGEVLKSTEVSDRLRVLQESRSLANRMRDFGDTLRLETTKTLLRAERSTQVRYQALQMLLESNSPEVSRLIEAEFSYAAGDLLRELLTDEKYRFVLRYVEGGTFVMGDDQAEDLAEKPAHKVTLPSFCLAEYALTNLAYERITGELRSRRVQESLDDLCPAVNLTWFDAIICALRIGCRLPSEAEWEYAARAGSRTSWCFGDNEQELSLYANYEGNKDWRGRSWPVGTGKPNGWGFYDMHGNVWEWCSDWFGPYSIDFQVSPIGASDGNKRVRRGGGHSYHARGCRSSFRWGNDPSYSFRDIGVRLACSIDFLRKHGLESLVVNFDAADDLD